MSLGAHISYFKLYQLQREKHLIIEFLYFHIFCMNRWEIESKRLIWKQKCVKSKTLHKEYAW